MAALDFSSGTPVAGTGALSTAEGTSSIADAAGNLLFYTNGVDVYDATHTLMPNGTGLTGDISSTQSALIIPAPSSNSQYYIFTTDADGGPDGLRYSVVDMTLNSGNGDIVSGSKNISLTDSITEKLAAVSDGSLGYWIVSHKWGTAEFLAYHLTSGGLLPPVISTVGSIHNTSTFQNTYGQLKFNVCGSRLAAAIGYQDIVEVFDFDRTTGIVSNPMTIPFPDHVYGVEFSRSSQLLYVSCYDDSGTLLQFDITLGTLPLILASRTPLTVTEQLYGLQLGPDNRIYVSRSYGSSYLGVVESPDVAGPSCMYNDFGIDLDPSFMGVNGALTLPAFSQELFRGSVSCSGITEIAEAQQVPLSVFPNPGTGNFIINGEGMCRIFSLDGKLVFERVISNPQNSIASDLAAGSYLLELGGQKGVRRTKLIIQ
jgi:hypothetical protein